jgi:NADH dehydrogenase FAD-containing subunit
VLSDFLHSDLARAFPVLARELATVTIVQSADHILNTYAASISSYTEKRCASVC